MVIRKQNAKLVKKMCTKCRIIYEKTNYEFYKDIYYKFQNILCDILFIKVCKQCKAAENVINYKYQKINIFIWCKNVTP